MFSGTKNVAREYARDLLGRIKNPALGLKAIESPLSYSPIHGVLRHAIASHHLAER